jgi:hypothetical protein
MATELDIDAARGGSGETALSVRFARGRLRLKESPHFPSMRSIRFQVNEQDSGQYSCECGNIIPYKHGIFQFVQEDDFYEGKFIVTHQQYSAFERLILAILRLISIDGNEERMWRKSVRFILQHTERRQLQILNIGSGRGHSFLNELGSVTAIDLSLKSLLNAQAIYDFCYQADARYIPFPDESFNLVFSSHLVTYPLSISKK